MVEYKYMNMYMEDSRRGTTTLSDNAVLGPADPAGRTFPVTPTKMNMEMHMVHLHYGLTDNVTIYMMAMLTANTMDHVNVGGARFTTHVSGFDDTQGDCTKSHLPSRTSVR